MKAKKFQSRGTAYRAGQQFLSFKVLI